MGYMIVTCAVTSSSHIPTMNSDIPVTVRTTSANAARDGAAVIHFHARNRSMGGASPTRGAPVPTQRPTVGDAVRLDLRE